MSSYNVYIVPIALVVGSCSALELLGQAQVYVELGGRITVVPSAGEPAFASVPNPKPVCVLGRHKAEFTIDLPGWTQGRNGDDYVYVKGSIVGNAIHCTVPRASTAGNTTVQVSMAGPFNRFDARWGVAALQHGFAFSPAFGLRPYCRETQGSIVLVSASEFAGQELQLEATIGKLSLVKSTVHGGRPQKVSFPLDSLPEHVAADANISLTLPDGRVAWHVRRFLRAALPSGDRPRTSVVQVDHESRAMRVDGVPLVANGWFHGDWDHESAGLPPVPFLMPPWHNCTNAESASVDCASESLSDHVLQRASFGQQSNVAQFGRTGLTFVRIGHANSMNADKSLNATRLKAYFDAAAAAGVYVLLDAGVDDLANSDENSTNVSRCESGSGDPKFDRCSRVRDVVIAARGHQVLAGYYGCDDCCHIGKGKQSVTEYTRIAQIKASIFELDPHSLIFGTIACGSTWLWQEAGAGLGLDVVMKESYGGGVGGHDECLPPYATAFGDCGYLRGFPMIWEPLWNMPSPLAISSPMELRSHVYAGIVTRATHSNNFYVYNPEGYNDLQGNAAVGLISAELQELLPSLLSTLAFDVAVAPHVSVAASSLLDGRAQPHVLARIWVQPSNRQSFCGHIVVVNTDAVPSIVNMSVKGLDSLVPLPSEIPVHRLFEGQTAIAMNLSVAEDGSGRLVDFIDALQTHVYQLGCKVDEHDNANLIRNGDFEEVAPARPTALPSSKSAYWVVQRGPATDLSSSGDSFDDRTRMTVSTAACWSGHHCGRVQLASTAAVTVTAPHVASNRTVSFRIHGRSSPAGVSLTIGATTHRLLVDWTELSVSIDNFDGALVLTSPHDAGAVVWLDAAEAFEKEPTNKGGDSAKEVESMEHIQVIL